jgi:general secretion pathway protein E
VVLAQRLVRTICPACRTSYKPTDTELSYLDRPPEVLYRGTGCDRCKGKGYFGRTGIFELLVIDNEIRSMITDRIDSQSIKNRAASRGMKTLRQDGIDKVLGGITTLEEVLRVTQKDYADISV